MTLDLSDPAIRKAVAEADARVAAHYATGATTLVDGFSADVLATWNGIDEIALVGTLRR